MTVTSHTVELTITTASGRLFRLRSDPYPAASDLADLEAVIRELRSDVGATQLRADLERVASERDTWRETCAALRAQESSVSGLLADAGDVSTYPAEGVGALVRQRDGALRSLKSAIGELREVRDETERLRSTLQRICDDRLESAWEIARDALGSTAAQTPKPDGRT